MHSLPRRLRFAVSRSLAVLLVLVVLACLLTPSRQADAKGPTYDDPAKTDADYAIQGEYQGQVGEDATQLGVQVIALGAGQFRAVAYLGGLPGAGWDRMTPKTSMGRREGDLVRFQDEHGSGVIEGDHLTVKSSDGTQLGKLEKIQRQSKTLGMKPPVGAVVLFDGSDVEHWQNGKMTEDKLLMQGTTSKQRFGDHTLHIEFRLPYQPEDRGQARGNSGIYLQGRYEVQMLDSFGLSGEQNECGGLYSIRKPDLNMCLPPLTWQTYDIEFKAARFDGERLVSAPRVTVHHNGVLIHNNVELPAQRSTTAAPVKPGSEDGPVFLQNHGNPVRYRNIWVVPHEQGK